MGNVQLNSHAVESQFKTMYNIMIRPFLEPFIALIHNAAAKIILTSVFLIFTTISELIRTPKTYVAGLIILWLCDFASGSLRALFDKNIRWDWRRWTRTAYKACAYSIALIVTSTLINMFPDVESMVVFQFVVVGLFAAQEVISIFQNLRITPFLIVAINIARSPATKGLKTIIELVKDKDKEIISRKQSGH